MPKVYLAVCCLNRPFDDQTQDRIRLEAEAVLAVLKRAADYSLIWISSEAVEVEVAANNNAERQSQLEILIANAESVVEITTEVTQRAKEIVVLGFHAFDALHVACAEKAGADVLLTTDDRFLRRADRLRNQLMVRVANPIIWLLEIT